MDTMIFIMLERINFLQSDERITAYNTGFNETL